MMFQYTAFVTIATVNLDKMLDFYNQFLGVNPSQYIPNVYAEYQLPGVMLGIFKPKQTHVREFKSGSSQMSLCLEVDNLEAAIAHLAALGYPPPGEIITADHGKEIYGYDPDGNRIIVHQPR